MIDEDSKQQEAFNEHSVCCSAPGKAILFGEHAVVYGLPAVAASLSDLRIKVLVNPITSTKVVTATKSPFASGQIRISLPDLVESTPSLSSSVPSEEDHSVSNLLSISSSTTMKPVLSSTSCICFSMESLRKLENTNNQNLKFQSPPTQDCAKLLEEYIRSSLLIMDKKSKEDDDDDQNNGYGDYQNVYNELFINAVISVLYLIHQILLKEDDDDIVMNNHDEESMNCSYFTGLDIIVHSKDLPVGAGLGSSAAFGVACAGALIQLREENRQRKRQRHITHPKSSIQISCRPTPQLIDEINQYAYHSEILLHGNPSGIDNSVSSYGGAILFEKISPDANTEQVCSSTNINDHDNDPVLNTSNNNCGRSNSKLNEGVRMQHIPITETSHGNKEQNQQEGKDCIGASSTVNYQKHEPLQLLLVYTHVPRSTKRLVAGVRELYEKYPTIVRPMLEAMGNIARSFCAYISNDTNKKLTTESDEAEVNDKDSNDNKNNPNSVTEKKRTTTTTHALLRWVQMNQCLLRAVNVSHPSLDYICDVVANLSDGNAAAKLTGAGGGGCAIVMFQPTLSSTEIDSLKQKVIDNLTLSPNHQYNRSAGSNNDDVVDDDDHQQQQQQQWKFTCLSSRLGGDGVLFIPPADFYS